MFFIIVGIVVLWLASIICIVDYVNYKKDSMYQQMTNNFWKENKN